MVDVQIKQNEEINNQETQNDLENHSEEKNKQFQNSEKIEIDKLQNVELHLHSNGEHHQISNGIQHLIKENAENSEQTLNEKFEEEPQKEQIQVNNNLNETQIKENEEQEKKEIDEDIRQQVRNVVENIKSENQQQNTQQKDEVKIEEEKNKELTPLERINSAKNLKETGRLFIQQKDYVQALKIYEECLYIIHPNHFVRCPDSYMKEYIELNNILLCNVAFCYYNLENYQLAIQFCDEILKVDRGYIKALFRKSVCYKKLGDYEKAYTLIKDARIINSGRADKMDTSSIQKEYSEIQKLYQSYTQQHLESEKQLYSKMINSSAEKSNPNNTNNNQQIPTKTAQKKSDQTKDSSDLNNSSLLKSSMLINNYHKNYIYVLQSLTLGVAIPLLLKIRILSLQGALGCTALSASAFGLVKVKQISWKSVFLGLFGGITAVLYKFKEQQRKMI